MSRRVVLIHLSSLIGWMASSAAFFRIAVRHDAKPTVYETVHQGSFAVVGVLVYAVLGEALRACSPPSWGLRRRGIDSEAYSDLSERDRLAVYMGMPRLTIGSVWSLVYGLGLVFFVLVYCVIARQLTCYYFLALGMSSLCVDEAIDLYYDCGRFVSYAVATSCACLAVILTIADNGIDLDDTSLFSLVWGMALPALTPVIFMAIKSSTRYYTLGGTVDLCEFGVPFASIVGLLYICVMDYKQVREFSAQAEALNITLTDGSEDLLLTAFASPWLVIPCVVFFTGAVLQSRSVDPLLSVAAVASGAHFLSNMGSALAVTSLFFVSLGLLVRIWGTESEPAAVPKAEEAPQNA